MRRILVSAFAVSISFFAVGRALSGQSAQVAADFGVRASGSTGVSISVLRDSVIKVTAKLEALTPVIDKLPSPDLFRRLLDRGQLVRRTRLEHPMLAERVRSYFVTFSEYVDAASKVNYGTAGLDATLASLGVTANQTSEFKTIVTLASAANVPVFAFTMSEHTVFAVGSSISDFSVGTQTFDISTNLIGTLVASISGSLGAADDLKSFLAKNIALGIGFPRKSVRSIETAFSVGLGSANIGKRAIWPVLAMQQLDTTASDIPSTVRALEPTQSTWSVPYLGVGFTLMDRAAAKKRLEDGGFLPVISVGVRLPYYYAGSAGGAFGALFTTNGHRFVGSKSAIFSIGVSVPLLRNDAP